MGMEKLIESTPTIVEAIERNDIPSLHDALIGLLNFRRELIQSDDPEAKDELKFINDLIGRIIVYLADWNGINSVGGKLLLRGAVSSRGEVLRLAAPIYDWIDGQEFKSKRVPMIGVVGPIASGKGTVGEVICKKYNAMHLPLSDRLREYAISKGSFPPHPREILRVVNDELKPRFGNPVFVRWTMTMANRLAGIYQKDLMSIDGFRSLEEARLFQENGGILIAITASADVRFKRLLARKRGADDFSREKFDNSDAIEKAWIDPIIASADIVIKNDGTQEELELAVSNYLETLSI